MIIQMINRTSASTEEYEALFARIAKNAEKELKLPKDLEVSVTFVLSRAIHIINRDYRGIDRITDVITFAARDDLEALVPEEMQDLGDIFINIDYAKKQAAAYGHSLTREVGFLFTHGPLHCLGYDHMSEADEKEMFAMQDRILDPVVRRV